nr:MAG TPA: Regulatory protein-modification, helix-turn-helix, transcriptional regulator, DNA [Caudoviricetes sp.]
MTQEEVGRIIGRAQSYASLRIKGLKPWTIDELDKLAPILGYNDVFALVNAMRQTQVNVDTDGHFIDSDMAQSMSGWSVDEQAAYVASHLDQFDVAAKKGDIEREQEAFEDLP